MNEVKKSGINLIRVGNEIEVWIRGHTKTRDFSWQSRDFSWQL